MPGLQDDDEQEHLARYVSSIPDALQTDPNSTLSSPPWHSEPHAPDQLENVCQCVTYRMLRSYDQLTWIQEDGHTTPGENHKRERGYETLVLYGKYVLDTGVGYYEDTKRFLTLQTCGPPKATWLKIVARALGT